MKCRSSKRLSLNRTLESFQDLNLNLGFSNVLLTPGTSGNLLGLGELTPDSLCTEAVQGVGLTSVDAQLGVWLYDSESTRDEILLASTRLFDDVDNTWSELLDGRDVVGEDTHVSRLSRDVDLDNVGGLEDRLVRQRQGEPNLIRWASSVGVSPDGPGNWGTSSVSQAGGNSKGVHGMSVRWWEQLTAG